MGLGPKNGAPMIRVNVYGFYNLGKQLSSLATINEPVDVGSLLLPLFAARLEVRVLMIQSYVPIKTARREAQNLINSISSIIPQEDFSGGINLDLARRLEPSEVLSLKNCLTRFETVLSEELAIANTYSVAARGIYNISDLIDNADMVLSTDLREILPDKAKYDLRQGGRCLAFDIPTAAAFHTLRAAEAVIKQYWESLEGKKWPYRQRDWGRYIEHLEKAGAPPKITTALNQIREIHRNPLMHPEDSLDLDQAMSLFGMANGVISLMLQEVRGHSEPEK
jgi:hypothetical protein